MIVFAVGVYIFYVFKIASFDFCIATSVISMALSLDCIAEKE